MMDTKVFVELIRRHVRDASIEDALKKLESPTGRRVSPGKRMQSEWYNALRDEDKQQVRSLIAKAVDEAVFGLLAVLDGSRAIADGHFELWHASQTRTLLNDPDGIGLNEVFNATD